VDQWTPLPLFCQNDSRDAEDLAFRKDFKQDRHGTIIFPSLARDGCKESVVAEVEIHVSDVLSQRQIDDFQFTPLGICSF
jgi:hypothetical protein